jgi:hypothetical protein
VCVCVCGALKHGVPGRLIPRPLLFMINIKYLLVRISSLSEPIIFADDTSVIISSKKCYSASTVLKLFLSCV